MLITHRSPVTVNPQSHGASLGAVLAVLGLHRALPLFHGSNGCSTFIRLELARHFRESIPLVSTALKETQAILGAGDYLLEGLDKASSLYTPDLIAVIGGSVAETIGEDLGATLTEFHRLYPERELPTVAIPAADYKGGLLSGFQSALLSLVTGLAEPGPTLPGTLAVLAPPGLTPGDLRALKAEIRAFGLTPLLLPDLDGSLGGYFRSNSGFLPRGGTPLDSIRALGRAEAVLVLGPSLLPVSAELASRFGRPLYRLYRHSGLHATDERLRLFRELSGREIPSELQQDRAGLLDAILDLHTYLGGRRVGLAGNPETLYDLATWLPEAGLRPRLAVASEGSPLLGEIAAERVSLGDLDLFDSLLTDEEILVAGSNARRVASPRKLPLWRLGFPVFDHHGAAQRATLGYRGSQSALFELANLISDTPRR